MLKEFPKIIGILAITTHFSTYSCGHMHVWAFLVKDRNLRTTQRKCPEGDVTAERSSTASKLKASHSSSYLQSCVTAAPRNMLPSSSGTSQTHLKAKCVGSFRYFPAMINQFILWHRKKTSRMASLVSRYPMRWNNTVCNFYLSVKTNLQEPDI